MKSTLVNGVPYEAAADKLYIYGSDKKVLIGSMKDSPDAIELAPNWQDSAAEWLANYRKGLKEATTVALQKAAEVQGADTNKS